ncbi:NAD(+) diphosphatase [Kordiimonas sp.]|uniref:NAD(+) diphosphatase n=1 Tax=Kordiimonas sp. TaxID=1970157 RepID=UPI003A8E9EC7
MALGTVTTAFSGNPLDRADQLRTDDEILGAWAQRDDARFVLIAEGKVLTDEFGDILWVSAAKCRFLPIGTTVFLGLDKGPGGDAPRYGAELNGSPEEFDDMFTPGKFREPRAIGLKFGHAHPSLGIIAQAKSMLSWHASHQFCAKCGAPSTLSKAGYERKCDTCEASHFPRTDPVVIMLAFYGDKALVGRGHHVPPGFYSALAGFMEPGETIEEAVARELYEEVGVHTTKVEYKTSQPWPWPSTLMIGCFAWVEDDELTIDPTEIDDAIWITKEQARDVLAGKNNDFFLPPFIAIARDLMDIWLSEA